MKLFDKNVKYRIRRAATLVPLALLILLAACSTTRRIPEGEQLYVGLKDVDIKGYRDEKVPEGVVEQLTSAVSVPPNNALFNSPKYRIPIPLGLWVYNNWNDPGKGLKHKIYEKLVAEPVLVSTVRPELRVKMLDEILADNGYFRGNATYNLVELKNPKKARISYDITTGPAFTLDSIQLLGDSTQLTMMIDSLARIDPYLQPGSRYSVDSLSIVRNRITNKLRNKGYYFFRPEFIEYLADSLNNPLHVDLRLTLGSNIPKPLLAQYRTGKITMYTFRNQGGGTPDTIHTSKGTLIQMKPSRLRAALMPECVTFREGRLFSVRNMNSTQTRLSRLGIFNAININVVPDSTSGDNLLDVEHFKVKRLVLKAGAPVTLNGPLTAVMCIDGSAEALFDGGSLTVGRGNTMLVPAGSKVELRGPATVVTVTP